MALVLTASVLATAGNATVAAAGTTAYPGKNGLIAFVRANQIYTISATGSGLKKLTSSGKNYNPVWNPAGTEIAYEHEAPAGVRNIWVMNANGSSKRQWTSTGTAFGSPAWSPDGETLLFTNGGPWGTLETTSGTTPLQARHALFGYNDNQSGLYTVVDGNNPSWTTGNIAFTGTNISGGNGNECDPPAGSSLFGNCIEVYNTSTRHFHYPNSPLGPLTAGDGCAGSDGTFFAIDWARWAPDGSNLLFQYQYATNSCTALPWSVSALNSPAPSTRPGDQQADYSPDGTKIVLANALPGQKANIIIESNTGMNRKILTQGYQPNWQPVP